MIGQTAAVARAWALGGLAALLLGACATTAREPWVLTTDALPEPPLRDLEQISTYPQALATTLDIMQQDLELPALEVSLIFLPDTKRFKELLLGIGYPPDLARESARQLIAIGGHRTVLINQARLEKEGWSGRVSILAHELGHVLQYELGGGTRGTSAQWLREGFSKWLELRVMETLDHADRAKAWRQAIVTVRNPARTQVMTLGGPNSLPNWVEMTRGRTQIPPLSALGSWPDWVAQLGGTAGRALYDYAFIAVTVLLEEHGVPAVLRYFELFAERQDPAANFLEVFGENEEEFEKRLHGVVWP
jgi:hypothetical protein